MTWCKVLSESRRDSGPNLRSCRFHSNMWVAAVCLSCTPWESLCPTRVLQLACIKGCWGFQLPWQVALIDNSGNAWLQLGEQTRFQKIFGPCCLQKTTHHNRPIMDKSCHQFKARSVFVFYVKSVQKHACAACEVQSGVCLRAPLQPA